MGIEGRLLVAALAVWEKDHVPSLKEMRPSVLGKARHSYHMLY